VAYEAGLVHRVFPQHLDEGVNEIGIVSDYNSEISDSCEPKFM
jgi:hypothetical protein